MDFTLYWTYSYFSILISKLIHVRGPTAPPLRFGHASRMIAEFHYRDKISSPDIRYLLLSLLTKTLLAIWTGFCFLLFCFDLFCSHENSKYIHLRLYPSSYRAKLCTQNYPDKCTQLLSRWIYLRKDVSFSLISKMYSLKKDYVNPTLSKPWFTHDDLKFLTPVFAGIHILFKIRHDPIWHDIAYMAAVPEAWYKSEREPTKDTPYLAPTGELWGAFQENWPRYNGTALYFWHSDGSPSNAGPVCIGLNLSPRCGCRCPGNYTQRSADIECSLQN